MSRLIFFAFCIIPFWLSAQSVYETQDKKDRYYLETSVLKDEWKVPLFLGFRPTFFEFPEKKQQIEINFLGLHETPITVPAMGVNSFPVFHQTFLEGTQGLDPPFGENFFLTPRHHFSYKNWFYFSFAVHAGYNIDQKATWYHLENLYSELRFRSFIFSVGRKPLYWGQSFMAPLLISDNATSLDHVSLSTLPLRGPSFLSYVGWLKTEIFLSRMNEDRAPGHDYFTGWRLGLMPFSFFETNVALIYQFGGKGIKREGPWTDILLEILWARGNKGSGEQDSSNVTNRAGQADFRFNFKNLKWPLSIYSEHHLEDCCGSLEDVFVKSYSYTYGIFLLPPKLLDSIRLEYTKTGNSIYIHGTWLSGFSNEGRVLGHPLGVDAQGIFLESRFLKLFRFNTFWEERGRTGKIQSMSVLRHKPSFQNSEMRTGSLIRFEKILKGEFQFYLAGGGVYIQHKGNLDEHTWEWAISSGVKMSF